MTRENLDKTINAQNTNNIGIDPNNLNNLIKNANDLQEVLRPHIVWDNKIGIWLNILNKIFPVIQKYTVIILSIWYATTHIILSDTTQKILDFVITKVSDIWMLLVICSTLVLLSFIKRKYK